jgi:uncharacterized membrane protein
VHVVHDDALTRVWRPVSPTLTSQRKKVGTPWSEALPDAPGQTGAAPVRPGCLDDDRPGNAQLLLGAQPARADRATPRRATMAPHRQPEKEDSVNSTAAVADVKHPALQSHDERRRGSMQNRVADKITDFAGSMVFVYVHIVWFIVWISLGVEKFPFGLLTMIVSLEAIFLSTFVMISQNRADAKRQVLADAQWKTVQTEEAQNEQLIKLSTQILDLTNEIHRMTNEMSVPRTGGAGS